MSTFIRQWQKHIIQARLGLHTRKLKYSKAHEEVIKKNKNRQSVFIITASCVLID